jgi:type II secretory pathway pseudopilin PulG
MDSSQVVGPLAHTRGLHVRIPPPTHLPKRVTRVPAFSLVELLVVMFVIAILVAILLPATQAVRESARRVRCQNNLRQIALSVLNYESATGSLPPSAINLPARHSWLTKMLSHLGEYSVLQQLDLRKPWMHPDNQAAISARIPLLVCTTAPEVRLITLRGSDTAAPTDYAVPGYVARAPIRAGFVQGQATQGAMDSGRGIELKEVTDGTSHTLLIVEVAGRPEHWTRQGRGPANLDTSCHENVRAGQVARGAWADPDDRVPLHGFSADGLRCPGSCAINCTNNNEAFSFHNTGIYAALLDSSVHFLSDDIEIRVYAAMITRSGGEFVAP